MTTMSFRFQVKATVAAGRRPAAAAPPPAVPDCAAARVTDERNVRVTGDGGPGGRPRRRRGVQLRRGGRSGRDGLLEVPRRRLRLLRPQNKPRPDESSTYPTLSGRRPGLGPLSWSCRSGDGTQRVRRIGNKSEREKEMGIERRLMQCLSNHLLLHPPTIIIIFFWPKHNLTSYFYFIF